MLDRLLRRAMRVVLTLALLVVWQPQSVVALAHGAQSAPLQCDSNCKLCAQTCAAPCVAIARLPLPDAGAWDPVRLSQQIQFPFDQQSATGLNPAPDTGPPRFSA